MGIEDVVRSRLGDDDADGVFSHYDLVEVIGRGGFSEVRKVKRGRRIYAMKVPLVSGVSAGGTGDTTMAAGDDDGYEKYYDEARRWARLSDRIPDSVVRLVDFNIDPFPWMVMELAECDMKSAIRRKDVSPSDVVQLLRALQTIHDMNVVHRDIKPENILLVDGCWKFSDFGLSKSIKSVSVSGSVKGTPEFMAPEQFMPKKMGPADERTDIWQMGILAFWVVVGRSPYMSTDPGELMGEICTEGPDIDAIPEQYRDVISKALNRDRKQRYQSAEEFADALQQALEGNVPGTRRAYSGESESAVGKSAKGFDDTFNEGIGYYLGTSGRMDRAKAYEIFSKGKGPSQVMAAIMCKMGTDTARDIAKAEGHLAASGGAFECLPDDDPVADWIRGLLHEESLGCEGSMEKAVWHYRKSAEAGFVPAQNNLALCYDNGLGVPQSYEEAVKWYRKAADQGYAPSQNNLGIFYYNGRGVPQSYEEAVKWYRKAADQGSAPSQSNLGACYENGLGVPQSYEEAVKWYRKAAEQGNAIAQKNLGFMYESGKGLDEDPVEAVKWYRKAAEQGNATAQLFLGNMYRWGKGVERSYYDAAKWYKMAADQGLATAQNNLGICYENGRGVPQSYEEAVKWYRKAAEQGHVHAQNNLGICYVNGRGVPQSYEEAVKWYRKAADQGNANAQFNLALCYADGKGVDCSPQSYIEWMTKAAENGHGMACYRLGVAYREGYGVSKSETISDKWFRKAYDLILPEAEDGDPDLLARIGFLFEKGYGVPQSDSKSKHYYDMAVENGLEIDPDNIWDSDPSTKMMFDYTLVQLPRTPIVSTSNHDDDDEDYSYLTQDERYDKALELIDSYDDDDVDRGVEMLEDLSSEGHINALKTLSSMYDTGSHVNMSWEKSAELTRLAANLGDLDSQCVMAFRYLNGMGVPKSEEEAVRWYVNAANQGSLEALQKLTLLGYGPDGKKKKRGLFRRRCHRP